MQKKADKEKKNKFSKRVLPVYNSLWFNPCFILGKSPVGVNPVRLMDQCFYDHDTTQKIFVIYFSFAETV